MTPARRGTWSCARHRLDGMIRVDSYAGSAEQHEVKPEPGAVGPAAAARRGTVPRVRRRKFFACVPKKAATAGETTTTTTTATVGFLKVEPSETFSSSTDHGEPDVVRVAARAAGVGERAASRTQGHLPAVRQGSRPARSTGGGGGGSKIADTHEKAHADESNVIARGGGSNRERDDGDDSETDPRGKEEHGAAALDHGSLPKEGPRGGKGGARLVVAGVRTDDDGTGVRRRPSHDRCKATDDGGDTRKASYGFPRSSRNVCSKNRRTVRQSLPNRRCGAPRAEEAEGGDNSCGGGGGGVSRGRVLGKPCAGGRVALQGAVGDSERRHARKKAKRADVGTIGDGDGGGGRGGGVDCGQPVAKKEVVVLGVPNPAGRGEGATDENAGWRFPTVVFDVECDQGNRADSCLDSLVFLASVLVVKDADLYRMYCMH